MSEACIFQSCVNSAAEPDGACSDCVEVLRDELAKAWVDNAVTEARRDAFDIFEAMLVRWAGVTREPHANNVSALVRRERSGSVTRFASG
jgi:hypothetical protein